MRKDVRENLKLIFKEKGLSQAAIARKINMPPIQLSMIINLKRKLEANEMLDLCNVIGITPTELRDYDNESERKN